MPATALTRAASRLTCVLSLLVLAATQAAWGQALPSLESYVKRADPSYACVPVSRNQSPAGSIDRLALTSQTWRGVPWKHDLTIYTPEPLEHKETVLLFITGGSNEGPARDRESQLAILLARLCGARVAVLPQVPNQPLMDGKKEDDLISFTFVEFMKSGDPDWPLLQPMAKSAVAAMNAIQARGEELGQPVKNFVVTGASKRGWTTWLSGAMDDRVIGIAPMVIPILNLKAQTEYQKSSWGHYSEQIDDYVHRGLMQVFDSPRGKLLWGLVDPYTYLDRITEPVLEINGTNDRYWTVDAASVYWNDIKAPHAIVYLPNAGHGLDQNRPYAIQTLGAFFRHVVTAKPLPKLGWTWTESPEGVRLDVTSEPSPKSVAFWTAESGSKDFRESPWTAGPLAPGADRMSHTVARDGEKFRVVLGDLAYEIDGIEYHLSTQIRIVDPKSKARAAD
jgi:PhoPQ-activated pathogenicity-related protein